MTIRQTLSILVGLGALLIGCGENQPLVLNSGSMESMNAVQASKSKSDASAVASFVDFEFDGELVTSSCWNAESVVY